MPTVTGPDQKPKPHIYGDLWERSKDPWHREAFPPGLEDAAPVQAGDRRNGWMAVDHFGNPIGFVPDGSPL